MNRYDTVDEYMADQEAFLEGLDRLRSILLSTELKEEVKWGIPTYTLNGKNVVGMSAFKEYFGIWFFQGVFLKDEANKLINAQEGKTKGLRQWRFQNLDEVDEDLIRAYVAEAIMNQEKGLEIKPEKKVVDMPSELEGALKTDPELNNSFHQLTPGKQREYMEYIGEAKREPTRISRLEKCVPMILNGVGLNDRYK